MVIGSNPVDPNKEKKWYYLMKNVRYVRLRWKKLILYLLKTAMAHIIPIIVQSVEHICITMIVIPLMMMIGLFIPELTKEVYKVEQKMAEEYTEKEYVDFIFHPDTFERWDCFRKEDREDCLGWIVWTECESSFNFYSNIAYVEDGGSFSAEELDDIKNFMKLRETKKAVKRDKDGNIIINKEEEKDSAFQKAIIEGYRKKKK